MKKLLTSKENYVNCVNTYSEDYTAFTTKGEPRGKIKLASCQWFEKEDLRMLEEALKKLGLEDYIEMEYEEDDKKAYFRIVVEGEDK